jgi:hypothetical protein
MSGTHSKRIVSYRPRPCAVCHEVFKPTSNSQDCCSNKCYADPARLIRRLLEAVKVDANGCFLLSPHGGARYRSTIIRGRGKVLVHRLSYELFRGPIPSGCEVCHECDIPLCINPAHLFIGTHTDNMRDASAKSRMRSARGEDNKGAKLTESDVLEIRRLIILGLPHVEIAARFNVLPNCVSLIKHGRNWAWLNPDDLPALKCARTVNWWRKLL